MQELLERLILLRHALLLLAFLFSFNVCAVEQTYIEVITSDAYPVSGIQSVQRQGFLVNVHNLDDGKRLVAEIGKHLPKNQDAAKKVLEKRFKKMGDAAVKQQFMQAYHGVILSTQYGLTRYPAVVFEQGQSVIYGVTNLNQAVNLYRQWLSQQ